MSDLIDRQELLAALPHADLDEDVMVSRVGALMDIADLIISQPTVDAVPVVHGHWIVKPNPRWRAYNVLHCSVCGWCIHSTKLTKDDSLNYCPECGAKMDKMDEVEG